MWETELKGQPNPNVKNAVGSKENWYNKASEYWEVLLKKVCRNSFINKYLLLKRLLNQHTMVCLEGLDT